MADYEPLSWGVVSGNVNLVKAETKALINACINPLDIINNGLVAGMTTVGIRFKKGEMFVPEVLMSSKAMMAGMDLVKPLLTGKRMPKLGKVIMGTVQGDLHDIGKNLVAILLENGGFEVVNIGTDIPPEKFVQSLQEEKPDIIGISALLTTTMYKLKDTIKLIRKENEKVYIIVGGAPITENFAREIGADGYAPDGIQAVDVCKKLLKVH
ncbi:MAG: cobalamin B12-binding domain-containing protein [Bacillota bacterium]|jgi:5-methyltetrahydrofolate--homocysteine methyltransferase|nr:cobalamin-binding protein [Clostridia bacterium]